MVAEEKIPPHDIAVLMCSTADRELREKTLASMPTPASAKFDRLEAYGPGSITIDSVARFKGLERAVIILWAFDDCSPARDREVLYVGMSRAKSVLYLCGAPEACELVVAGLSTESSS
jgi:superfamily I DNA and RNA helicase